MLQATKEDNINIFEVAVATFVANRCTFKDIVQEIGRQCPEVTMIDAYKVYQKEVRKRKHS